VDRNIVFGIVVLVLGILVLVVPAFLQAVVGIVLIVAGLLAIMGKKNLLEGWARADEAQEKPAPGTVTHSSGWPRDGQS